MNSLGDKIDKNRIPCHVAIIMDGNGRWAQQQGMNRVFGHQNAIDSVRAITEAAAELGVRFLTLYTFSIENWNRPRSEIDALMELLAATIEYETPALHKNRVRVKVIGDELRLPEKAREKLNNSVRLTAENKGLTLVLALSYSSRWEIMDAVKHLYRDVQNGKAAIEDLNEELFSNYLSTTGIPDPDLLIRTSGELRISNFLLWQLAYAELYFTDKFWPDFRKDDFFQAILDFQNRERRFGKTGEQLKTN
jgi:undecaprenyl diphosphate synthase